MTQLNFTLERDFFTGLFKKDREQAFGELMENLLNQFLLPAPERSRFYLKPLKPRIKTPNPISPLLSIHISRSKRGWIPG